MAMEGPIENLDVQRTNMTTVEPRTRSIGYRIGWWVLMAIAAISILNHLSAPFVGFVVTDDEKLTVLAFAAMNIYALTVLVTAYRRAEPWAWWVTWTMVATYGLTILYTSNVGRYYLGGAAILAIAQLATWSAFQKPDQTAQRT